MGQKNPLTVEDVKRVLNLRVTETQSARPIADAFDTVEELQAAVISSKPYIEYDGIGSVSAERLRDWELNRFNDDSQKIPFELTNEYIRQMGKDELAALVRGEAEYSNDTQAKQAFELLAEKYFDGDRDDAWDYQQFGTVDIPV
jgi:hypothetical protein